MTFFFITRWTKIWFMKYYFRFKLYWNPEGEILMLFVELGYYRFATPVTPCTWSLGPIHCCWVAQNRLMNRCSYQNVTSARQEQPSHVVLGNLLQCRQEQLLTRAQLWKERWNTFCFLSLSFAFLPSLACRKFPPQMYSKTDRVRAYHREGKTGFYSCPTNSYAKSQITSNYRG